MSRRCSSFVPGHRITADLVTAWRALAGRAAEANVFAEPEVVLPAIRHLAGRSRAGVLVVADGDELVALLPVVWPVWVPVRGKRFPAPLVSAWVDPYQQLGTPLVDAADPVGAMAGLLRPPLSLPAPLLLLRYFGEGGPVADALDEALARRGREAVRVKTYERALLLRSGGPPPSRNRKQRYRRAHRYREDMERDLGPVRIVDRSEDPRAVDEFLALEAAGWKAAAGTALACRPSSATWFREVCDGLRAQDRLEVLSLEAGGRTAAMVVDFRMGDGAVHAKSAYDESLAAYRPGEQLLVHRAERATEDPCAWRDSATLPDNTVFNQLWPARRTLSTVVVPLHGPTGSAAVRALRFVQAHRERAS